MTESTIIMMTKEDLTKFVTDIMLNKISTNNTLTQLQNLQTYNRKEVCEKLDLK